MHHRQKLEYYHESIRIPAAGQAARRFDLPVLDFPGSRRWWYDNFDAVNIGSPTVT